MEDKRKLFQIEIEDVKAIKWLLEHFGDDKYKNTPKVINKINDLLEMLNYKLYGSLIIREAYELLRVAQKNGNPEEILKAEENYKNVRNNNYYSKDKK